MNVHVYGDLLSPSDTTKLSPIDRTDIKVTAAESKKKRKKEHEIELFWTLTWMNHISKIVDQFKLQRDAFSQ